MRRIILILPVIACLLMLYAGSAYAAGVASGTVIGNFATMTATNVPSATQSNTVNNSVTAVYGVATESDPLDGSTGVGSFVDYLFEISNPGNESQEIMINVGAQAFSAGAGTTTDWSVAVDDDSPYGTGTMPDWEFGVGGSGGATAAQAGDWATAVTAMPLAPDAMATYTLRVTVAGDAVDGATGDFVVKFYTNETPLGPYVGYNTNNYGGPGEVYRDAGARTGALGERYLTTTVQGPVLTLAKYVVTIDSNLAGYTGGLTDPVPGAKIKYRVEFSNTGTTAATTVEMSDQIPANTTYVTGSLQSCFTGPGCGVGVDPGVDVNNGGDDCWYLVGPPKRVGCDMATMTTTPGTDGGAVEYEVTIN